MGPDEERKVGRTSSAARLIGETTKVTACPRESGGSSTKAGQSNRAGTTRANANEEAVAAAAQLLTIEGPIETRNRLCHSRESGNPDFFTMFLDPRFRGGDNTGCICPFKNQ